MGTRVAGRLHRKGGGVHHLLTELRLNPHETRAIDIRKLRDAQQPDSKNNTIPAGATDGSVLWLRLDNVPVMGRLAVITRHGGMASSYDCCLCGCPGQYNYTLLIPVITCPITVAVGNQVHGQVWYSPACGGTYYYFDMTTSLGWSSTNTGVFTLNNSSPKGLLTGVGVGSAFANAQGTTASRAWYMMGAVCQCSSWVVTVGNTPCSVVSVQVTSVNLPSDQVSVTLSGPSGTSGQLVVTWNGPSGNANIASGTYGPGTYTFNPSLSSLVSGQYTGVTARWTVNGSPATGSGTSNFRVLGTYAHTTYNTPAESQCSGNPATAYLTTGPASCPWSTVSLIDDFIGQAWSTGSGATSSYGLIQEYLAGCSSPPGGNQNYFRQVSQVAPGCSSPNNSLGNTTVAADVFSQAHPLSCGDSVLIVGLGGGVGTVKTVTDSCPACNGQSKLDNYSTTSACHPPSVGSYPTIRINR